MTMYETRETPVPAASALKWTLTGPSRTEVAVGAAGGLLGRAAVAALGTRLSAALDKYQQTPKSPGVAGDSGFFGPDSVIWRVMADPSIFVAGGAAVSMQGLHPRAFAGFADHTDFNGDPDGRLRRTQRYLMATTYGDLREARSAIAHANRMHRPVKGTLPDGRTYDAGEPELMTWVHLTIYAGIAAAYRRFGAEPLSDADLDRFVAESAVVGAEFGVIEPPTTWAEMDAQIESYRRSLSINVRAAKGISFFREPFGLPKPITLLFAALWPGAMTCMAPMCRQLMMQPEPTTREMATCRAIVRAAGAIAGPNPSLVRAQKRISRPA